MVPRERTSWVDLDRVLDAWRAAGRTATFWWRDDDAIDLTPALDRLFALSDRQGVPLMLAVIPAKATPALGAALGRLRGAVLQHGYAHVNHAPASAPKSELSAARPLGQRIGELEAGRRQLAALVGGRLLPVLVPPWNRIDDDLVDSLAAGGYRVLSTFRPRRSAFAREGLSQVNTHVDLIDWTGTRRFIGVAEALAVVIDHLAMRCGAGPTPPAEDEPTGILSHHLAMDEASWDFLAHFIARTQAHPGARWLDAAEIFPQPGLRDSPS